MEETRLLDQDSVYLKKKTFVAALLQDTFDINDL